MEWYCTCASDTHSTELKKMLPFHIQKIVSIDAPFPRSYQISFRVAGGKDNCYTVNNYLQDCTDSKNYTIKGKELKISVELSPERKKSLNCFYTALAHVEQHIPKETHGHSMRNLEIFCEPSAQTIGKWNKDTNEWDWNLPVCLTLAIPPSTIQEIKNA